MKKADQKEFYIIQRLFFIRFIIGLLIFFFGIFFAATFMGMKILQPVVLDPFLLVFSVITSSFGYAALLWDMEMRKFQRRF